VSGVISPLHPPFKKLITCKQLKYYVPDVKAARKIFEHPGLYVVRSRKPHYQQVVEKHPSDLWLKGEPLNSLRKTAFSTTC